MIRSPCLRRRHQSNLPNLHRHSFTLHFHLISLFQHACPSTQHLHQCPCATGDDSGTLYNSLRCSGETTGRKGGSERKSSRCLALKRQGLIRGTYARQVLYAHAQTQTQIAIMIVAENHMWLCIIVINFLMPRPTLASQG